MDNWQSVLFYLLFLAGSFFVIWLLLRITHSFFRRLYLVREGLHLRFFERLICAAVVIGGLFLAISFLIGAKVMWKTILGGTAFISALLIFAAQDAIKDVLAGLMISIYKPFEIGNRVELEDGTTGIVKDISMRHVVLQQIDSQVLVIPNSRLNAMNIRNFSYHADHRAAMTEVHIAYGSNVEEAMTVIREAVMASPYTIPGKQTSEGMEYAQVYFMAYESSSLRLDTTVYYEPSSPTEIVISDVNLRIGRALKEHGIEIPYAYLNVVQKTPDQTPDPAD